MKSKISVLVTPRDGNHYQDLLYRDITLSGVRVRYAEGPTHSQTINIFLAPFILGWWRMRGCRILHIHWTFQFYLPWANGKRWARRLMGWWFGIYLRTAQLLGYRIVWTAHDLLPHEQIFDDDRRARDLLVSQSAIVIALSEATAIELHALGAQRIRVIPMGFYADPYPMSLTTREARATLGLHDEDVVIALIGRIERYKGVDLLLAALSKLPTSSRIKLLLVGLCSETAYRDELNRLIESQAQRVVAEFTWVPDGDLARYFQATDIAVFPFREVTNSASVLLAQSFGRPVVIPDLPSLSDIPEAGAMRFSPKEESGVNSLVATLQRIEMLTEEEYREMAEAALTWAAKRDWVTIARETTDVYREALL